MLPRHWRRRLEGRRKFLGKSRKEISLLVGGEDYWKDVLRRPDIDPGIEKITKICEAVGWSLCDLIGTEPVETAAAEGEEAPTVFDVALMRFVIRRTEEQLGKLNISVLPIEKSDLYVIIYRKLKRGQDAGHAEAKDRRPDLNKLFDLEKIPQLINAYV